MASFVDLNHFSYWYPLIPRCCDNQRCTVSYSEHYNVIVSSSQQCTIKIKDYVIMTSLIHNVHVHAVQEPIHRDGLNKL